MIEQTNGRITQPHVSSISQFALPGNVRGKVTKRDTPLRFRPYDWRETLPLRINLKESKRKTLPTRLKVVRGSIRLRESTEWQTSHVMLCTYTFLRTHNSSKKTIENLLRRNRRKTRISSPNSSGRIITPHFAESTSLRHRRISFPSILRSLASMMRSRKPSHFEDSVPFLLVETNHDLSLWNQNPPEREAPENPMIWISKWSHGTPFFKPHSVFKNLQPPIQIANPAGRNCSNFELLKMQLTWNRWETCAPPRGRNEILQMNPNFTTIASTTDPRFRPVTVRTVDFDVEKAAAHWPTRPGPCKSYGCMTFFFGSSYHPDSSIPILRLTWLTAVDQVQIWKV